MHRGISSLRSINSAAGRLMLSFAVTFAYMSMVVAAAAADADGSVRAWTLRDIVTVPQVTDLVISSDGREALYILRRADLVGNVKISSLHRVDLASGVVREVKTSPWLSALQAVPGSSDWSVLADLGEGVQLYRFDGSGRFGALLINPDVDQVGFSDEGVHPFGISAYGWSPDGKSFWYEKRTSMTEGTRVVNPQFLPMITIFGQSPVELRVRGVEGSDVLLHRSDAITRGYHGIEWSEDGASLSYWARPADLSSMQLRRWSRGADASELVLAESASHVPTHTVLGPRGGPLTTLGYGADRRLIETLREGAVIDHGSVDFRIDSPRASQHARSPDGSVTLLGVRYYDNPRYGLVRVSASAGVEKVAVDGSLTHCSIDDALSVGVCVRQSMVMPPQLIRLDPRKSTLTVVAELAPEHAEIAPLRVVPRTWINSDGYRARGFIVYPRNHVPGRAYPAILVTHGGDADQRFVDAGFQWDYPIQALAERGYVVMAMNEPASSDSAALAAAYGQWVGSGSLPIERVQDLVWINIAHSFEDAVKDLVAEGLVDGGRVGIAGYSRGSQLINVAMTQSRMFNVASSGDGGYLEPSAYFTNRDTYRAVYGGSPYDPAAVSRYQRLSPTFRASLAAGPILQQVATGYHAQLELHVALREAGVPSEIVQYPGESHLFHKPSNRLAAMQENIDWFDFWLLGKEDPDPAKSGQYARWRALRAGAQ